MDISGTVSTENFTFTMLETSTNASDIVFQKEISQFGRILVTVFGILMSLLSFYISAALFTYKIKRIKANQVNVPGSIRKKTRSTSKSRNWMDFLSFIAALLALSSSLIDHPLLYAKQLSTLSCKIMQSFSHIFYSIGHSSVYLFLWFRQRSCYKNPSMAKLHNRYCRLASAAILPIFLLMTVTGITLTGFTWKFASSPTGCVEVTKSRTPIIALFIASAVMQTALLLLFLYPLKSHKNFLTKRLVKSSAEKVVSNLIKRSVISTSLCILADATAFIFAMSLNADLPFIVINYIYDANLLCNVICMIASFVNWKHRILPCCYSKKIERFRPSTSSFASTTFYKNSNVGSVKI